MFIAFTAAVITISAVVYWYVNRHKPTKHMLSELRYLLDMQGAGVGGLIDDWINVWRNKIVLPHTTNKVAVITGGARGIGTEVVRGMLKANITVIMGIRNPELAGKLGETMENGDKLRAFHLDLQSLKSIENFCTSILKEHTKINILINNAGIMYGDFKLTEDGIESQFAVNYLSHFYLTHLLLPALKNGATIDEPSRIINVSSCGHFPGKIYFDDISMKQHYDTVAAYAQSKLAQIMMARHLSKLLKDGNIPIKCYSVHPGIVDTDLFERTNFSKLPWIRKIFFKTPEKGAVSILFACFNKDIEKRGGIYISNCQEGITNGFSKKEKHQEKLFKLSCDLVGIDVEKFGQV